MRLRQQEQRQTLSSPQQRLAPIAAFARAVQAIVDKSGEAPAEEAAEEAPAAETAAPAEAEAPAAE